MTGACYLPSWLRTILYKVYKNYKVYPQTAYHPLKCCKLTIYLASIFLWYTDWRRVQPAYSVTYLTWMVSKPQILLWTFGNADWQNGSWKLGHLNVIMNLYVYILRLVVCKTIGWVRGNAPRRFRKTLILVLWELLLTVQRDSWFWKEKTLHIDVDMIYQYYVISHSIEC